MSDRRRWIYLFVGVDLVDGHLPCRIVDVDLEMNHPRVVGLEKSAEVTTALLGDGGLALQFTVRRGPLKPTLTHVFEPASGQT